MAWYDDIFKTAKDTYKEYKTLIDLGGKAGKAYLDYKDQKRRNELDEQGYRDYMLEKESSGREAQTAVDMNLTPMTVTGVPTSKADVTDFTALAANGGIISLRNGTPNPGIAALRKEAPEVVKRMGFENGSEPNPGIAALRKKAPEVVKRMGFEDGTGENGVQMIAEEISTNPLKQIIEKIKKTQYKRKLGTTDDGDLAERTSEYVDNNPFKKNITAIREPNESENRAMLNAMISDGLDTEAKMDEASKEKIILSLLEEMRRSGEMEKKEYDLYMEAYSQSLNQGGIAGLRNGGRPGYMMGEGPVMDNTVRIDDAIETEALSNDKESMEMAYNSGTSYSDNEGVHGIERARRIYNNLSPKMLDMYPDFLDFFESGVWHGQRFKKGGIAGLRNGGRPGYRLGEGPVMDGTVSIEEAVSETKEPMKMAYEPGVPTTGDLYDMKNPDYDGINPKIVIEFIEEGIPLGYTSPEEYFEDFYGIMGMKKGGRVKRAGGGVMDLGGKEKDYRFNGGFVPIGEYEKKDDVPARLSKNEFVFTADAVRAAGGGSINKGAQKMYNTMKTLEAQPQAKRMTT